MDPTITEQAAWERECTRTLEDCVSLGAVDGAAKWTQLRSGVPLEKHLRIKDSDFSRKDLSGFDFSFCKFRNVKFVGTNLKKTSFRKAIVREANFTSSDVRGATFADADLRTSVMRDVHIDDGTDLALISGGFPDHMDQLLKDRAEAARRRAEFERDRSRSPLHKAIVKAMGYGESVKRLLVAAVVVIGGFGFLFWAADRENTSWQEAAVYSVQYFVALGDPYAETNFTLSVFGTLEAALGLLFLALLLSAVTRHLIVNR
jgi:hypothetical protein